MRPPKTLALGYAIAPLYSAVNQFRSGTTSSSVKSRISPRACFSALLSARLFPGRSSLTMTIGKSRTPLDSRLAVSSLLALLTTINSHEGCLGSARSASRNRPNDCRLFRVATITLKIGVTCNVCRTFDSIEVAANVAWMAHF